jgi:hypothetical protein
MNMKTSILALSCFLIATASMQAQLVFETTDVEIKAGLMDKQTTAVFRFTNESDKTVAITDLKSSCGCTVPELAKREYAPGESGEIKAVFNFGGRQGIQRKRITVGTTGETYSLAFTTDIPDWASVEPQILRWSINNPPSPKEVRLRIESPDQVELVTPNLVMEHFTVMDVKAGDNEWIYSVVPKNTAERATERVLFKLHAKGEDAGATRELAFHCLIR